MSDKTWIVATGIGTFLRTSVPSELKRDASLGEATQYTKSAARKQAHFLVATGKVEMARCIDLGEEEPVIRVKAPRSASVITADLEELAGDAAEADHHGFGEVDLYWLRGLLAELHAATSVPAAGAFEQESSSR